MGFLPTHSFNRPPGFTTSTTNSHVTTTSTTTTSLPSRHPSTNSSTRFSFPRLPPARSPSPAPTTLRRQGSDLSITYSLGSHYNTPLKEAMACWSEDIAEANKEEIADQAPKDVPIISQDPIPNPPATSRNSIPGLQRRISLAPPTTRLPSHSLAHPRTGTPTTPSDKSIPPLSIWTNSASSRTVTDTPIPTPKPHREISIGITTQVPISEAGMTTQLDDSLEDADISNNNSISYPRRSQEPKIEKRKRNHRRRWVVYGIGLLATAAGITAIVLLVLDRVGVVSWTVVKERIVQAAKSVGTWFSSNFSPKLSSAAKILITLLSTTLALTCLICLIIFLRRRRRRRRNQQQQEHRRDGSTVTSNTITTMTTHKHISGNRDSESTTFRPPFRVFSSFRHKVREDPDEDATNDSDIRNTVVKPQQQQQEISRTPSTASLGLVHYGYDYLLVSDSPGKMTSVAAEPVGIGKVEVGESHVQQQYWRQGGGGGQVVRVLP